MGNCCTSVSTEYINGRFTPKWLSVPEDFGRLISMYPKRPADLSAYTYCLELENHKYYVGMTRNPYRRFLEHFGYIKRPDGSHLGAKFTSMYKPTGMYWIKPSYECGERFGTLLMMHLNGIENVRGYCWSRTESFSCRIKSLIQTYINDEVIN